MNILVTGGAGFIGSHLVDALVEAGHRVRVLDAIIPQVHGDRLPPHLNPDAEFLQGDMCDSEVVERALEDVEAVFHHAAEVGVGQSMYQITRYVRANTLGTAVLLEALADRRHQVRKLIVASSMSIYGEGAYECANCGPVYPASRTTEQLRERRWDPECSTCHSRLKPVPTKETKPLFPGSVYAIGKQDQEQLCLVLGRAYGIPTIAFRYWNVYGTRQALSNPYTGVCAIFCGRLLNDQPPMIFEDGEQRRDFVHVSDIVQANLLALETNTADYQALNIGSGETTTVREVAAMLAAGLGKSIEPIITNKFREGDVRHCVPDIALARTLLGYKPRVTLEQGMPELLEWVRSQTAKDNVDIAMAELAARQLAR